MPQKVLLLVNTGTPDSPDKGAVKKYLSEFLNDPFVIDISAVLRKVLVNLIIIPFRASKSAGLYSRLWTEEGSPLKVNTNNLVLKLQVRLKDEYLVLGAMRYGNPSVGSVLGKIHDDSEVTIFPMFPQYASATTGSVKAAIEREIKAANKSTRLRFINQFYSHPSFIDCFAEKIQNYRPEQFDHLILSYHSLPVRQITRIHPEIRPDQCNCDKQFPRHGSACYRATCYMTSRLIAQKLSVDENFITTAFQSRLSKNWIGPFTDKVLLDLASKGKKKILLAAPSFVSDCLETLIEIGEDYRDTFLSAGGKELVLVESLNDEERWADAIISIIKSS